MRRSLLACLMAVVGLYAAPVLDASAQETLRQQCVNAWNSQAKARAWCWNEGISVT